MHSETELRFMRTAWAQIAGANLPSGLALTLNAASRKLNDPVLQKILSHLESCEIEPLLDKVLPRPTNTGLGEHKWIAHNLKLIQSLAEEFGISLGNALGLMQEAVQYKHGDKRWLSGIGGSLRQEEAPDPSQIKDVPSPLSENGDNSFTKTFVLARPDESPDRTKDNFFVWNKWQVSFASSRGPRAADKNENQDAVAVVYSSEVLVFAVCDGVSTSYGSRFGAAYVAATFAEEVFAACQSNSINPMDILLSALGKTQADLTELVKDLVEDPGHDAWTYIRSGSRVQAALEKRLVENTLEPSPQRSWAPVLATTIIGGFIEKQTSGYRVCGVRVGDGVVERLNTKSSGVEILLGMDIDEMAIEAVIAPGPRGRESLSKMVTFEHRLLGNQALVVSSDGLVRGIRAPTLSEELGIKATGPSKSAGEWLHNACVRSDETVATSGAHLYGDNLSLFLLKPTSV